MVCRFIKNGGKTLKDILIKAGGYADKAVNVVCTFLIAVMTCIVLLQVSTRFLPVKNPSWTEELSRYIMIYIAYIGASIGIREWTNVGVDFVLNRLSKVGKFVVNAVIRIAILVFWCVVIYLSVKIFPKTGMRQYSASMKFPIFYAQLAIVIGAVLSIIQSVIQVITYMIGGVKNA
ncbi:TRAP transporter small permease [bacterium 1XD8-76]|nr:TRAP transporter small permease [bacterium 1XD8-76]